MEKSSLDSALNISFCVLPQKKTQGCVNNDTIFSFCKQEKEWARESEKDELEVLS